MLIFGLVADGRMEVPPWKDVSKHPEYYCNAADLPAFWEFSNPANFNQATLLDMLEYLRQGDNNEIEESKVFRWLKSTPAKRPLVASSTAPATAAMTAPLDQPVSSAAAPASPVVTTPLVSGGVEPDTLSSTTPMDVSAAHPTQTTPVEPRASLPAPPASVGLATTPDAFSANVLTALPQPAIPLHPSLQPVATRPLLPSMPPVPVGTRPPIQPSSMPTHVYTPPVPPVPVGTHPHTQMAPPISVYPPPMTPAQLNSGTPLQAPSTAVLALPSLTSQGQGSQAVPPYVSPTSFPLGTAGAMFPVDTSPTLNKAQNDATMVSS